MVAETTRFYQIKKQGVGKMEFSLFFNFDGNCKDALEYYAKVFKSEIQDLMLYGETPPEQGFEIPEEDKNKVMYANVPIFGCNVMFCDTPTGMPLIKGNNISPVIGTENMEEIKRIFAEFSAEGEIEMELQNTFWSDLYGMVTDKFGICWQLSHDSGKTF